MTCRNLFLQLAVLLLFSVHVRAQSKADSLLQLHALRKADASAYNELIWLYVFNRPDSAIYFGNRGVDWCKRTGKDSLLSSIHNRIGVAYDIKTNPDSALYFYNLALQESREKKNEKTEAGALNNIGLIYWNLGESDKAIDHFIQAAEKFDRIGNLLGLGNTYNNIGLILFEDGELVKSRRYYDQALRIRSKIDHRTGLAATYLNISQLFSSNNLNNLDSAIYYLNLAIPLYKEENDRYGLARAYRNMADFYSTMRQYDKALEGFRLALNMQLELGNSEGYASTYYNMANTYRKLDDKQNELMCLDSAELFATQNNDLSLLWKVYRSKARAFGSMGRHTEAYPYWIRYDNLKDSVMDIERSRQVEALETEFRTAQKDREIAEKKTALAEAKLKLENRNKWIFGLLGGLASLLLLGFALFQLYSRKKQSETDAAIIRERELGLQAMIKATEEERKRIAKDLHDGVVQSLTGLSLRLQKGFSLIANVTDEQRSRFVESKKLLDESIAEVRNISHQMMPRSLAEMGLGSAIADMLQKSLGSTDVSYEFDDLVPENDRLPEFVEVSVFRVCQELVNNIIKHSQATHVSVQLVKNAKHLIMTVEDNGRGFDMMKLKTTGIGLKNIQSRIKAVNGEVSFEPGHGKGTLVIVRIPLT
jgi:signal transduction histidine kinase